MRICSFRSDSLDLLVLLDQAKRTGNEQKEQKSQGRSLFFFFSFILSQTQERQTLNNKNGINGESVKQIPREAYKNLGV